jgi:hypothetical protein
VEEAENGQQALDKIEQSTLILLWTEMWFYNYAHAHNAVSRFRLLLTANAMIGFEQQFSCTAYLANLWTSICAETLAERCVENASSATGPSLPQPAHQPAAPVFRFSLRKSPITSRLADSFCACPDEMFIPAGSIGDEFRALAGAAGTIFYGPTRTRTVHFWRTLACVQ